MSSSRPTIVPIKKNSDIKDLYDTLTRIPKNTLQRQFSGNMYVIDLDDPLNIKTITYKSPKIQFTQRRFSIISTAGEIIPIVPSDPTKKYYHTILTGGNNRR